MRYTSTLCVCLIAVALQACAPVPVVKESVAPLGIPAGTPLCTVNANNAGNCVIELEVSDDALDPQGCVIKLRSDDNDLVTLRGALNNFVYWRIVGPGYIFTKDGIAFVDNFRPRMFSDGERLDTKDEFQWQVIGSKRRVNSYIVNVRNGGRKCSIDPWVRTRN